ncbi:general substrate transporter [Cylindrobasidium torrendii FP15055 ss-10]|uniref:General substrate transporter n=1 Tax=Cylindrobasidium torrendii FP15055 ss-10 TaxID=1314674 RepID=A0A0D7B512_9AGAR|nr:general substrate transporter [Cylindrobasidium torrendii FP15055 ss-10]
MIKATIPTNRRAVLLAIFIAFGGFLFGYDIGVISGCLIMPDFAKRFGEFNSEAGEWQLNSSQQSIITSLLSAGTFIGSIGQAFTSDRYGRRGSILMWAAVFTVGTVIQTTTDVEIGQMVVGRFVAGLGVGATSAIVPLYSGETSPKALRGTLLVTYQLQIIFGIFISYLICLCTHNLQGSASWRIPVGLQIPLGLIILSGMFFLPESPRYLLGNNRIGEARKVLAELNGVPEEDCLIEDLVEDLLYGIKIENDGGKATWGECFSSRNMLWKRTMNGMMLQFIQQLNGQNFYYYYGDTYFKSAGTTLSPYAIQTILGGVSLVGTIPALASIERMGRRQSLLVGSVLEGVCSLIAGFVGHFTLAPKGTPRSELTPTNRRGGDIIITFAVLHVFSFSIFWGPVPWVYLGESFPLRVRPKAIALGSATNWLWNFLLSFFAPRISEKIDSLIMLIFSGMLAFGWCYVYLFIPETRGLSLEEVDEMYRAGVKPWHSVGWEPSLFGNAHETVSLDIVEVSSTNSKAKGRWESRPAGGSGMQDLTTVGSSGSPLQRPRAVRFM